MERQEPLSPIQPSQHQQVFFPSLPHLPVILNQQKGIPMPVGNPQFPSP